MNFEFLKANAEALILMATFSIMGGIAQYVRKVKAGKALFSLAELVGEIAISVSAGLTAGLLVMDHASMPMALAVASVAGHMGTRLIYALESALTSSIKARLGGGEGRAE